jgi:prevent-host-death family protein
MMIMQNIRPSAELRNKYNEISTLCKETREPVYITVNGHGDTVILSLEQFNQMQAELELLKMLAESEENVRNGRVSSIENTFNDIRKKLDL